MLHVGYDRENAGYGGEKVVDRYGRSIPKSAHGTANLGAYTSGGSRIIPAVMELFHEIVDERLTVRRVNVAAIRVLKETAVPQQLDLFTDAQREQQEKELQRTLLRLRKRYGNNAVLKGLNYRQGATTRERNSQIGGHKA